MAIPKSNGDNTFTIVLRDLQSVLVPKLGSDFKVVKYATSALLAPGENFASTILKVHAVVKKKNGASEEDLHLVAKMYPCTEFQRFLFDSPFSFQKEIFLYSDLIPMFKNLERECGILEKDVFDITPEFYGARLSLKADQVDDDAVILLENLKVRGFYTVERREGMDIMHARKSVKALARFHALGMAIKMKKPEQFEILKERSKCFDLKEGGFDDLFALISKMVLEDPQLEEHSEKIRQLLNQDPADLWNVAPSEPWATIIHSDFWVNNIMFHRDQDGNLDDIKFIDFQNYLFQSPLRELILFLGTCPKMEVLTKYVDELIDLYYKVFVSVLKRMSCDIDLFEKESFLTKLKVDARLEFPHCVFMLKVETMDTKNCDVDLNYLPNVIMANQQDSLYLARVRKLVNTFIYRGWI